VPVVGGKGEEKERRLGEKVEDYVGPNCPSLQNYPIIINKKCHIEVVQWGFGS
jgi:hypothetical protein